MRSEAAAISAGDPLRGSAAPPSMAAITLTRPTVSAEAGGAAQRMEDVDTNVAAVSCAPPKRQTRRSPTGAKPAPCSTILGGACTSPYAGTTSLIEGGRAGS